MTALAPAPEVPPHDVARPFHADSGLGDRVFRSGARSVGVVVLLITGGIGIFLAYQAIPTVRQYRWSFFTTVDWSPGTGVVGIVAVLAGTILVALVAISVAFPLGLATALYITEYAPSGLRSTLVSLVDLMAAVPSIVYGLWGVFLLQDNFIYLARWLHQNVGFVPLFAVRTDPDAASWSQLDYTKSMLIAGVVVAMMVLPVACSVMREVFSQTPPGEREAALALGSTRWGVVRTVVLPFGRGGIVGGTMLGLGRALGETIAVVLVLSPAFELKWQVAEIGGSTISSLIALSFGEADPAQLSALLAAGLVLFLFTLVINSIAAVIVGRSRSGSSTDI